MSPMPTPQQVALNWKNGMSASTAKMQAGIDAVQESPTAKAARRADAYMAGVQRAVTSNKWQNALNAVTLEDWKKAMKDKGVTRVSAGAAAAQGKFQDFMTQFLPFLQQGVNALANTPRGDLETNIQRSVQMQRYTATFRRQR